MQLKPFTRNSFLGILTLITVGISGCKDAPEFEAVPLDPSIVLDFKLMHNGNEVLLDQPFIDNFGFSEELLTFKFYLSNLKLTSLSGEVIDIANVKYVDFEPYDPDLLKPQWNKSPKIYIPKGDYNKIQFGVGLPEELNSGDPTTYENEDPLGTYSNMYWTWATQYRFIILEARADTLGGDNRDMNILFHTGTNGLYRDGLSYDINVSLESFERDTIHFEIDWDKLFIGADSIDLKKQSVTHTTDSDEDYDLAEKFTDNFINAISLKP